MVGVGGQGVVVGGDGLGEGDLAGSLDDVEPFLRGGGGGGAVGRGCVGMFEGVMLVRLDAQSVKLSVWGRGRI